MIKVGFVRGKYLNNFEAQNYDLNKNKIKIVGISSLSAIHRKLPWDVIRLPSVADLSSGRIVKYISNRLLGDSQILFGLKRKLSNLNVFHTADPHYYYSYQLARLRAKGEIEKLISTSWEIIPFNNESVKRKKFIKKFTKKYIDLFICHTQRAKDCLIEEGVSSKKIKIVGLGVDLKRFKRKNYSSKSKNITILFVGRLVSEKGIMDLYEAYRKLKTLKSTSQIKLKIVGEGPLKNKLSRMAEDDGFENIVSIEQKTYEQMPDVYQSADIFVLPSKRIKTWEEQYGMAFIEAMASALPIITYGTGAIPELVGRTNIIVSQGNIEGLTNSLKKLVSNEALRRRIGTMNRRRAVSHFNSAKTAKKMETIYHEVNSSNSH